MEGKKGKGLALLLMGGKPKPEKEDEDESVDPKRSAARALMSAITEGDEEAVIDAFEMMYEECGGSLKEPSAKDDLELQGESEPEEEL